MSLLFCRVYITVYYNGSFYLCMRGTAWYTVIASLLCVWKGWLQARKVKCQPRCFPHVHAGGKASRVRSLWEKGTTLITLSRLWAGVNLKGFFFTDLLLLFSIFAYLPSLFFYKSHPLTFRIFFSVGDGLFCQLTWAIYLTTIFTRSICASYLINIYFNHIL